MVHLGTWRDDEPGATAVWCRMDHRAISCQRHTVDNSLSSLQTNTYMSVADASAQKHLRVTRTVINATGAVTLLLLRCFPATYDT